MLPKLPLTNNSKQRALRLIDIWMGLSLFEKTAAFDPLVYAIDQLIPSYGTQNIHIYNVGNVRDRIAEMSVVEDN